MIITELPRLKHLLDLMGIDNGSNVNATAPIPRAWEMRAQLAEEELLLLSPEEIETLAMGEETEQQAIARKAPRADAVLLAVFDDGELADVFFTPWNSIYDAREAEARVLAHHHLHKRGNR